MFAIQIHPIERFPDYWVIEGEGQARVRLGAEDQGR